MEGSEEWDIWVHSVLPVSEAVTQRICILFGYERAGSRRVHLLPISMRIKSSGTLMTSCFREQDSQSEVLRLNEATSTNIPLAIRVMAGPAGKLKW